MVTVRSWYGHAHASKTKETLYLSKFNKKHLKKLFYTNKCRRFSLRRNIYFIQNINFFKILSLLKFMQGFNQKNFNQNKKIQSKFKQNFRFLRNFLSFKTIFEEIKTKPDLENKINSNIEHRQSPVFLFYFKVPPRGLIW